MDSKLQPSQAACWNYLGKEKASPYQVAQPLQNLLFGLWRYQFECTKSIIYYFQKEKNAQRMLKNDWFFQKQ